MKHVLVVWCELPEEVKLLVLEVPESDIDLLESFQDQFVNGDASEEMTQKIMKYFYDEEYVFKHDDKVLKSALKFITFDLIVKTGFYL